MLDLFAEVVGWLGAGLILGSYALLTLGKLEAKSIPYQAMNVVGALGFIVNSSWNGAIPSAALNVVWAGIGIAAIVGIMRARRKATPAG
jgi:hypothetical protein